MSLRSHMRHEMLAIYNLYLLMFSFWLALGLIQHSVFFYHFPPQLSDLVQVEAMAYVALTAMAFFTLKALFWTLRRAEIDGKAID